jgi:diguanylate cyclase (GGDEF)-like protein
MGAKLKLTESNAKQHIDALNEEVYVARTGDPEEMIERTKEVLDLARKWDYQRGIGQALRTLAAIEVRVRPSEGYVRANEAIDILESCGDTSSVASALMSIFCYYHHVGWFQESIQVLQEAFEKANRSGNDFVASIALYNMGVSSEERADYATAISFYKDSMTRADHGVNEQIYWMAANAFAKLNANEDPSEHWIEKLKIARTNILNLKNVTAACDSSVNLAEFFGKSGKHLDSMKEFRWARNLATKNSQLSSWCAVSFAIAESFILRKKWKSALRTLIRVQEVANRHNYAMMKCRVLERRAFVERELGLFSESIDHLYDHLEIKEALLNEQTENRLRDLQTYHRLDIIQTEAQLAKRQNEELAAINEELHMALERQEEMQKELMRLASTDELTGCLNRRQVINDGILEMERYRHTNAPFCVSLIDIDHFKNINDTYGHSVGDEVLRRLAKLCESKLRKFDVFGRLGGEEFCIIHHDTSIGGASAAVERLLVCIRELPLGDILNNHGITASMGICEVKHSHTTFYEVLHDADMALYAAKSSGRNNFKVQQSHIIQAA